ncbi:acetylornithine deacetylase [Chondromyces apiculatus]|uniref:Acetylornithine deacetylase n=1 Tax=Chondromyces apiculatus DSM 436 TaxID=1192034 RepID=A0A017THB4_9BACT|nr:acetylornithine deacetylase [Chondromyces apiculatus]EYF08658.1 Acetylornithine deacetylase [Chondromyces apiculatus DSM 436]
MTPRSLLERLVAFPTVSRDSNLPLIDFVEDLLRAHGIAATRVPSDDGTKANLHATIGPEVPDGIVLSGHTDVVPVDGQPWDTDPFTLVEKDGRLHARGAVDMKAFIATALALIPEMKALKRPIHLALSYDEEVGCAGAPRLIREICARVPRPRAVIVGEPTSLRVATAHKGIAVYRTTVTGHEAHSSLTHRGVSAVMTAARLITWLDDRARERLADPQTESGFEPPCTSIHVGKVQGGTAVNIISRHCEFWWDVRTLPGDSAPAIAEALTRYADEALLPDMRRVAPEVAITTEALLGAPGLRHDPDSAATALALALTGARETGRVPFATEAGLFQEAGIPAVVCGPGSIDQAHQPNEYITLDQLHAGEAFLRRLIAVLSG